MCRRVNANLKLIYKQYDLVLGVFGFELRHCPGLSDPRLCSCSLFCLYVRSYMFVLLMSTTIPVHHKRILLVVPPK